MNKISKIISGVMFLALPAFALAHTKWFAEGELFPLVSSEPTALYLGIIGIVMLVIILFAIFFHQRNKFRLCFLEPKGDHKYQRAASTFTMIAGAFFLVAGTHEYLFSPNLSIESGIPPMFVYLQILIGIAFMLGIGTRTAAIILSFLWLGAFYPAGWISMIENIWVLSTAIFIMIMGNDYFSLISFSALKDKFEPYKKYGLSLLRLGTGATLVILGFSEKILAPEFGTNFLTLHQWNFMEKLGINFSDYLFTLSAGSVEILFGLIFILGVVTRFNALIVAIVFTIPLFILGPIELAGHIPHFAAVVMLLLFGNGGHYVYFKKYPDADFCKYHD